MKYPIYFILGIIVGALAVYLLYPEPYYLPNISGRDNSKVYLNGGVLTTSTVGVIYGYHNDLKGCSILAAGMNYYYKSDKERRKEIMKTPGHAFCSHKAMISRDAQYLLPE